MATQKALVLHKFGGIPVFQDYPVPKRKQGQLLVQVQATTINPSDRMSVAGSYFPFPLPSPVGLQGVGKVIQADQNDKQYIGKRVSFVQDGSGSWGQFSLTNTQKCFIIDEDVPVTSAASGIVNPLTVVGMVHIFEHSPVHKGIIHTAAASSLGRMLNRYCKTLGIPLLNIVRRQQHADLLKSQGAEHVIITQGEWQKQYASAIQKHGFNILFDALGGGPITQTLIMGLPPKSTAHIYGYLEAKPLQIKIGISLSKGISITGYLVFGWFSPLSKQEKQKIRKQYSKLLKTDLSTTSYKILPYSDIGIALQQSVTKASIGKITLIPK